MTYWYYTDTLNTPFCKYLSDFCLGKGKAVEPIFFGQIFQDGRSLTRRGDLMFVPPVLPGRVVGVPRLGDRLILVGGQVEQTGSPH